MVYCCCLFLLCGCCFVGFGAVDDFDIVAVDYLVSADGSGHSC